MVNRVAFGAERIVLTSRGKPKAVLISLEDYEKLQKMNSNSLDDWEAWKKRAEVIVGRMAERAGGTPIDFDAILEANRTDLEDRKEFLDSVSMRLLLSFGVDKAVRKIRLLHRVNKTVFSCT